MGPGNRRRPADLPSQIVWSAEVLPPPGRRARACLAIRRFRRTPEPRRPRLPGTETRRNRSSECGCSLSASCRGCVADGRVGSPGGAVGPNCADLPARPVFNRAAANRFGVCGQRYKLIATSPFDT